MPRADPTKKWDEQYHWWWMLPPGRPSRLHLEFFASHINRQRSTARIAILGSTPELRDLCVELDHPRVVVLDRSQRFHHAMNALLIHTNSLETTQFGDWTDLLEAAPNAFDVILSDLTLRNISYERRPRFFASLRGALRPNGIFLDKGIRPRRDSRNRYRP